MKEELKHLQGSCVYDVVEQSDPGAGRGKAPLVGSFGVEAWLPGVTDGWIGVARPGLCWRAVSHKLGRCMKVYLTFTFMLLQNFHHLHLLS